MNRQTRKLTLTALFIALGIILPMAFHGVANAGAIFAPMHIPTLICGLAVGPLEGLVCGMLTPFLSSVLTGMPPAARMPGMVIEIGIYGLMTGLLMKALKKQNETVRVYGSLVGAMLCGRIVAGLANALIFSKGGYSLQAWFTGYFVTGLPGICIHLVVVPLIYFGLKKAKLI